MRFVALSVVVHVIILVVLLRDSHTPGLPTASIPVARVSDPPPLEAELFVEGGGGGAAAEAPPVRAPARHVPARSGDAWEQVAISMESRSVSGPGNRGESGAGNGNGAGSGDGDGTGIGLGGGIRIADDLRSLPIPAPPPLSKARAARLIYPARDREVDDEGNLFVARVTVDEDGDVVGARMVKTRPGSTGDQAASAIWTFRYLPALNDAGRPIRSTFEQPFQIR